MSIKVSDPLRGGGLRHATATNRC